MPNVLANRMPDIKETLSERRSPVSATSMRLKRENRSNRKSDSFPKLSQGRFLLSISDTRVDMTLG